MKELIGKKVRGFRFEGMPKHYEEYVGKIGTIEFVNKQYGYANVKFKNGYIAYMLSQIEAHLVEETKEEMPIDLISIDQISQNKIEQLARNLYISNVELYHDLEAQSLIANSCIIMAQSFYNELKNQNNDN